ncbi:LLM class flavin-dependent oxidoreductase [Afifella sp. IM 167]|uniref:LLM class flavin-dependent oxidoreductase n=1 Tax=Afifella sp. IM 167 TaxID=2033586 RepID=UPI001CCDA863|nr:LLM class flavin-dependent oxidoreductase [Afifella sp. IM 167]MBZ8133091.1 5,10-methylene tetrahydromethanopterin reductase [Afifella sp. IM 167]
MSHALPLSVLDLVPVPEGRSAADALRDARRLAQAADRLGYARLWYAEHHGMPSIASASPEVLIGDAAGHTTRIRVGSGGVMLPNHVPLRVVETYRTLAALYDGRIDLGIGRAGGSDQRTLMALRSLDGNEFARQIAEMRAFEYGEFPEGHPFAAVGVVPDEVRLPPVFILGSSGASAEFAGLNGYGYGFAGHFSHSPAAPAFEAYRAAFRPSRDFPEPRTVLCLAAITAEEEDEARFLAGSMELSWLRLRRGEMRKIASPEEAASYPYEAQDRAVVEAYRRMSITGTPAAVLAEIEDRAREAGADEAMLATNLWSQEARIRSFTLLAGAAGLSEAPRATRETALA